MTASPEPPSQPDLGSVFQVASSAGYSASERFLAALCRRSFLSLWSVPNCYRAQAKELIDVLVIFGDDVILFSDKDIAFNTEVALDVAWARWSASALDDSFRQLRRAKNWLHRHPDRLYLDAKATQPLPVRLPPPNRARYHLVATARGAFAACGDHFGGGYGSLPIDSGLPEPWRKEWPFMLGRAVHKGSFVHVFDDASLNLLLQELDTLTDFVQYLQSREELLQGAAVVQSPGEEQLLAAYLAHMRGDRHWFLDDTADSRIAQIIRFEPTNATKFFASKEYHDRKQADRLSYEWDRLVETFITIGHPGYLQQPAEPAGIETALRIMAAEPRFARRMLSEALRSLVTLAAADDPPRMRFRTVLKPERTGLAYVYLTYPKRCASFEEYREHRVATLKHYCSVLLAKNPGLTQVIGIAFDHPRRDYQMSSEDLLLMPQTELSEQDRHQFLESASELGWQGDNLVTTPVSRFEYVRMPDSNTTQAPARDEQHRAKQEQAKKKKKTKAASAKRSRRKNRR